MPVGRLYADVVKLVSLCLIYGPLFPFAYLLTAMRLVVQFWATLFTITFLYGRPAALTEKLMDRYAAETAPRGAGLACRRSQMRCPALLQDDDCAIRGRRCLTRHEVLCVQG